MSNPQDPNSTEPTNVPTGDPAPTTPAVNPDSLFADQLQNITTDDGRQKYADVATALNSIPHAQSHIKELTDEVTRLKEEAAKNKGAEELLESLRQQQQAQQPATPAAAEIGVDTIDERVQALLNKKAQEDRALANGAIVEKALTDKFGDKAAQVFEAKAAELGMPVKQLTGLAQMSPQAAMQLFGEVASAEPQPTTPSTHVADPSPTPAPTPNPLDRFSGGSSALLGKWRKAGESISTT